MIDGKYIQEIIDCKRKGLSGISVYCCICVFTKKGKNKLIYNGTSIEYDNIDKSGIIFLVEIKK